MKARVVQLFADGVRRTKEELHADRGATGDLVVSVWATPNASGRAIQRAAVTVPYGQTVRDLLVPIFDVQLIRITPKGMLLSGFQNLATGKSVIAHRQEWWCELVTKVDGDPDRGSTA